MTQDKTHPGLPASISRAVATGALQGTMPGPTSLGSLLGMEIPERMDEQQQQFWHTMPSMGMTAL